MEYVDNLAEEGLLEKGNVEFRKHASSFLDLGTGNGHLLYALQDNGWLGRMVGIDYSEQSIKLARQIAVGKEAAKNGDTICASGPPTPSILFEIYDILGKDGSKPQWLHEEFDCLLDKGTFDAISLNRTEDAEGKRGSDRYASHISELVRPSGFVIITSCNWTEEELRGWFENSENGLQCYGRINYPTYRFGGRTGQTVVTVCFQKKRSQD